MKAWFVFAALAIMSILTACGTASGTTTGNAGVNTSTNSTNATVQTISSNTSNGQGSSSTALKVTSVNINLSVPTIRNLTCGTNITETYTATFHFPTNNAGGQVQFNYT